MQPIGKQPERKPIRRRARTPQKEIDVATRKRGLSFRFFAAVDGIEGVPKLHGFFDENLLRYEHQDSKVVLTSALVEFLGKRGITKQWINDTAKEAAELTIQRGIIFEQLGSKAISRKDEVLILRKMRYFLAAIKEAKKAGIY